MARAKNLRELLLIRDAERNYLNSITGNLGSALGLKNGDGDPCVTVFVEQKIDAKWLGSGGQVIKRTLRGPGGLTCPTDVVEGRKYETARDIHLIDVRYGYRADYAPVVSRAEFLGPPPLQTPGQIALREQLRGWAKSISPGAQLFHGDGKYETLGCFVRKSSGKRGILTNEHVAGSVGDKLYFPNRHGLHLATVKAVHKYVTDENRFPGIINEWNADYRVDCAFAELESSVNLNDLEARIPALNRNDEVRYKQLGSPVPLDLETMGPIGISVVGVGRTRSFQRGTVAGFAYSYSVDTGHSGSPRKDYTDLLIVGEDGDQFSAGGDSGKLIVTDEVRPRPVGLLWGGKKARLRQGRMQEKWTYGIDINKVLDILKVSIVKQI